MELRHIRYFVAVAEELHFARAAARLSIAQPSLSLQIRQLEDEVGLKLLDRSRNRVRLTASGRSFLVDAHKVLADVERAVEYARSIGSGSAGELRIGYTGEPYAPFMQAVEAFQTANTNVMLSVTEFTYDELISAVYNDQVDLGCYRQWASLTLRDATTIGETPMRVALPPGHALAEQAEIPLRALATYPFVMLARSVIPGYTERIMRVCAQAGFVPNVAQEVLSHTSMLYFVGTDKGIAIFPDTEVRRANVEYRPLVSPNIIVPVAAVWKRDARSPELNALIKVLPPAPQ